MDFVLFTAASASLSEMPSPAGYIVVLHDNVASPSAVAHDMAWQTGGAVFLWKFLPVRSEEPNMPIRSGPKRLQQMWILWIFSVMETKL